MTFVVHRGERADVLADALADVLADPLPDPFQADVVAVHARGIERWLTNRLATRLGTGPAGTDGVCANLEFPFPGRLVGGALAAATGIDPLADPWEPSRSVWPLLAVVDAAVGEPWLGVLASHVGRSMEARDGDEAGPPSRLDRRFAAARHLADLYDRYAVHRPEMVLAWRDGRDEDGAGRPLPEDAVWQAELWRRLRATIGTPSPPERLVVGCERLRADPGLVPLPERIALFGLTRLPVTYVDVLRALSVHRDVHLLALHPSATAWQELAALVDGGPLPSSVQIDEATHHPLLRLWGRDAREMHVVLAHRLGGEARVERDHPVRSGAAPTLLARVQDDIRADRDLPRDGDERPVVDRTDRSVQIHACHGKARQAEVVRDAITHLLAADATLQPRDIVILCPDIDEMAPLLRSAFEAGRRSDDEGGRAGADLPGDDPGAGSGRPALPYRLADRSLRQTNPVLGATADLLALVDSRLTATQVLAFAALAPVRFRFRFDDDDLERIAGWVDATGTRWGLDRAHRAPFDLDQVDTGTWASGLQRVLLGIAMSEDDQRLVAGVLPLDDVDSGDIELAGRFAELVRRLGTAVEALAGPMTVADWADAIDEAADLLLHTRRADGWQRGQLDHLLADVRDEAAVAGGEQPELRLAEVRDLLADRLRGRPTRAAFRTGDLTMCTLVPMRSVPHRVVCIVGLDDGSFPRGGAGDGDDVLQRDRRLGDHDRRSEDRQLLLDALMSAEDALVITYAGRDVRTNEVLPPAVPVDELLDVLDRTAVGPAGGPVRSLVVSHHPLQPADARCFRAGALEPDRPWSFDRTLLRAAVASLDPAPERPPLFAAPLSPVAPPVVELADLVRFVEAPVSAFLRQRLGLVGRSSDGAGLDAIPVELDDLEAWAVGDRLLSALLAGASLDAAVAAERARGLLPPGALAEQVLSKAAEKAKAIFAAAHDAAAGTRSSLEIDVVLPEGRRVVGTVPEVIGDVVRAASVSRLRGKQRIAAWVRYLAATASHPQRPIRSATVGWGGRGPVVASAPVLADTPETRSALATRLLTDLVDLHDRGMREPLPLIPKASFEYAVADRSLDRDPVDEARKMWNRGRYPGEQSDAAHVTAFGGEQSFDWLRARPLAPDEHGEGWADDETTRFGRLARRLWDPVLDVTVVVSP